VVSLFGRSWECVQLDRLVDDLRAGSGRTLVIRGGPGVGKTALMSRLAAAAVGVQVLRTSGVGCEVDLLFAGLHQLLSPLVESIGELPQAHRDALRSAFGMAGDPSPDRFMVGMAALGLLTTSATDDPLICLVDDAHSIDQASVEALGFVARRLDGEGVAIVFAERADAAGGTPALRGLPSIDLEPLEEPAARDLLRTSAGAPVDRRLETRILVAADGNPLALLEVLGALSPAQRDGSAAAPDPFLLSPALTAMLLSVTRDLPKDMLTFLLIAALEPDAGLMRRASSANPSAGCPACGSIRAFTMRWAAGWAAYCTRCS
jgi:hypothetical protein